MDSGLAGVLISGILGFAGIAITALAKFVPPRQSKAASEGEDRCHRRMAGLETRLAVIETNHLNFGRGFEELRVEVHEMRKELRELGRKGFQS